MDKTELYKSMKESVLQGDREKSKSLAESAVQTGLDLHEVVEKGFVPGITAAGDLWEKGEYFLPELVSSAESMKAAMAVMRPELEKARAKMLSRGKVVIGTIEGDIHDIGKNLVAAMLSANGFEVYDLGADVKLERFIEKALEVDADIIGLSALLTTTMLNQRRFIEKLRERKLDGRFKVMVGGAPVTRKWAEEIGASGFAENAASAVRAALDLVRS